jgi:hypothetical protein
LSAQPSAAERTVPAILEKRCGGCRFLLRLPLYPAKNALSVINLSGGAIGIKQNLTPVKPAWVTKIYIGTAIIVDVAKGKCFLEDKTETSSTTYKYV